MGRRPRSRATRAERRMQKERAASALAHGLPVPTPLPTRTRGSEYSSLRPPASTLSVSRPSSVPPGRRMPLAVKLLAGGLGLLVIVYGLTLFRDHKDAEAARAPVAPESQAALADPSIAPVTTPNEALASAEVTSASSPVAAASLSASASRSPMLPLLAQRMKSVVAALQAQKAAGVLPSTSAVQPNLAAALVPPSTAPAGSAVK
jgi:hypothetical protein